MPRRIDISYKTIIFITGFLLGLWLLYQIRDLILLLFAALIVMSALAPMVSFLEKFKFPKAAGILVAYIIIITVIGAVLVSFIPPVAEQTTKLVSALPPILAEQFAIEEFDKTIFQQEITSLSKNIFSFTLTVFDSFVATIFLLVLTFYLLLEREGLEKRTASLFVGNEERVRKLLIKIEDKLGAWLRGQLFLSIIIGVLTYIGLTVLNIPYSLPLALLAGLMEVVPVIGPIIAAIPAVLIAVTVSPVLAMGTAAMYFIIQQLENHLVIPQVMKRAVGLNPLVVILAISVGGRLLGIAGALLAVPITVVLQIILIDILESKRE